MKRTNQITIELIDTDDFDKDNIYYLYEVNTGVDHFYFSDDICEEQGIETYPTITLLERADMTEKEWHIACVLFSFLWNSDNGTNTCMDYEQLEEENITKQDVEQFISKFPILKNTLDVYEDEGVEIYWGFLCSFDLNTCNFFKEEE